MSFLICLLTLASHPLQVLIPRFAVELLRQTEAAALSFASELRERQKRKEREGKRDGGQAHPCLKTGDLLDVRCAAGDFLTLWRQIYARTDVPSWNMRGRSGGHCTGSDGGRGCGSLDERS